MADIKNLFSSASFSKDEQDSKQDIRKIYYYAEDGFEQAGYHGGNMVSFRMHLNKIYRGYIEKNRRLKNAGEEKDEKLIQRKNKLEAKRNSIFSKIEKLEKNDIESIKEEINNLKDEINQIEEDPHSVDIEKPDKFGFYIGIAIIVFLTIYLWIFYSSAIYSAFFREIRFTENAVFNSIFYAKSFIESFNLGFAAFLLTIVAPFIFLALGYLIYKYSESKKIANYFKIGFLLLITFLFDAIIAFEITKKIYDALALNSLEDLPPYNIKLALTDVNFWLIIFAGFVVYIVWGMVLSFVAEGYKNFDTVKSAIISRKKKIEDLKHEINIIKDNITNMKNEVYHIDSEIKNLDEMIGTIPFNRKEFEKIINEFASGWMRYLANSKEPEHRLQEAEKIVHEFINNVSQNS